MFQFQTEDQSEEDAYWEGYRAYQNDEDSANNPYCSTTEEILWEAWKAGYYDAGWDD